MRNALYRNSNPDFEGLITRFLAPWAELDGNRNYHGDFMPQADLEETKDHYLVSLDIPGIDKNNVKIELHHNVLSISGERKSEVNKDEGGIKYSERKTGVFHRSFTLPESADAKSIEAHYDNGILEITIPKSEKALPQQIKIGEGKSKFGKN